MYFRIHSHAKEAHHIRSHIRTPLQSDLKQVPWHEVSAGEVRK